MAASIRTDAPSIPSHANSLNWMKNTLAQNHKSGGVKVSADGRVLPTDSSPLGDAARLVAALAAPGEAAQKAAFALLQLANASVAGAEAITAAGGLAAAVRLMHAGRPGGTGPGPAAPWTWIAPSALALRLLERSDSARVAVGGVAAAAGLTLGPLTLDCGSDDAETSTYALRAVALLAYDGVGATHDELLEAAPAALLPAVYSRLQDYDPASARPTVAIAATTATGALAAWGGPAMRSFWNESGVVPYLREALSRPDLIPVRTAAAAYALDALADDGPGAGPALAALEANRPALEALLRVGEPYCVEPATRAMAKIGQQ